MANIAQTRYFCITEARYLGRLCSLPASRLLRSLLPCPARGDPGSWSIWLNGVKGATEKSRSPSVLLEGESCCPADLETQLSGNKRGNLLSTVSAELPKRTNTAAVHVKTNTWRRIGSRPLPRIITTHFSTGRSRDSCAFRRSTHGQRAKLQGTRGTRHN